MRQHFRLVIINRYVTSSLPCAVPCPFCVVTSDQNCLNDYAYLAAFLYLVTFLGAVLCHMLSSIVQMLACLLGFFLHGSWHRCCNRVYTSVGCSG